MRPTRIRAVLLMITAILGASVAIPAPVMADSEVATHGRVGRHAIVDTTTQPGAHCGYRDVHGDMVLASLSVRAPVVHARDRTSLVDRQRVAWRIQLMGWVPDPEAPWQSVLVPLGHGTFHAAIGSDRTPAAFTRDAIAVRASARAYEVRVRILWFAPDDPDRVVGRSLHAVDRYAIDGVDDPTGSCLARVL